MIGTAREYYEQLQEKYAEDQTEQLIEACFDYATRKRLDAKKLDPNHMDIGQVSGHNYSAPNLHNSGSGFCSNYSGKCQDFRYDIFLFC